MKPTVYGTEPLILMTVCRPLLIISTSMDTEWETQLIQNTNLWNVFPIWLLADGSMPAISIYRLVLITVLFQGLLKPGKYLSSTGTRLSSTRKHVMSISIVLTETRRH